MSQIRLRILGECVIEVGENVVEPSATHVFALLLYLAVERGKLVTRSQLASMLFPEGGVANTGHNLRQLLYRLRRIGVPLEATGAAVRLPAQSVVVAPESVLAPNVKESAGNDSRGFTLLPGYTPPTDPLSRWLEAYRDELSSKLLRWHARELTRAREGADWSAVEHFARSLIELDPLNETATLGLAEALARSGSKHRAVKLLSDFAEDVGQSHASLALPPRILRRRISEEAYVVPHRALMSVFLGRSDQIRQLTESWAVARGGRLCIVTVTGERSIGKTRVLEEFLELVRLDGTGSTISLRVLPSDRDRPMSLFSDLSRHLLQLPGAAGCSPEHLASAKRLGDASKQRSEDIRNTDADASERNTRRAVLDLIDSVATERPLVVSIDDADQLDTASKSFLSNISQLAPSASVLFLVASNQGNITAASGRTLRLGPLSDKCARDLAIRLCGEGRDHVSPEIRDWCIDAAAGNPGHLALLLQHATALGDIPTAPPDLVALLDAQIASLSSAERHVLQACATFGTECCPQTIEALTGLSGYELLVTLERLADRGLVTDMQGRIRCRSTLLTERVLESTQHVVTTLLHQRAAAHLEKLAGDASTSQAVAWRISNHRQAAGDRATALKWRRICWHQSLSIGQPLAAADAIRSQLSESITIHERATLLGDLAVALQSAGHWSKWLEVLNERRLLCDAVGDDDAVRIALAADVIEARRHAYEDITPLVPDLQVIIHSRRLDHERRLCAARTLLIAADCLLEPALASEALEVVGSTPQSAALEVLAQEALLIYHAVFGDRATAIRIADSLDAVTSAALISARGVAKLTNTLNARRIVEAGDTNYRHAIALYEKCASASMSVAATQVASRIGNFLAEDGEFEHAKLWAERARHWKDRCPDKRVSCDYLSLEFDLALREGHQERALMLGESVLELFPMYASPRYANEHLVYRVRQSLIAGHAPIEESTIARLIEWHERAKCLGRHDDHMEALWGALVSAGRENEASRLLEEYVLSYRREHRRLNYWLARRTASDAFWQRCCGGLGSKPRSGVTASGAAAALR